jgi:LemA protein
MYAWIIVGVVIVVAALAVLSYNQLVSLREQVRSAWAQIDVALKRRHDLIPNLVETVKGYASHERQTLENVIAARNRAASLAGASARDRVEAEGALSGALRQLFAVAEAYPDLKANANFLELQRELTGTENQIASQRQGYNALVARYNTTLQSFPMNLMAGAFGFTAMPFLEIQDPAQREAPVVKF